MQECMFEKIIRNEREKQGISVAKLAEMTGLTSRAVHYWESGQRGITLKNAEILANALGITITIGKRRRKRDGRGNAVHGQGSGKDPEDQCRVCI